MTLPSSGIRGLRWGALALALSMIVVAGVRAEQLPVRRYTPIEGLPHTRIERIVLDSRGFLWFCSPGGVSRFDGEEFVDFRVESWRGADYNDIAEGPDGVLWVGAWRGGIARLDPRAKDRETALSPVEGVSALIRRLLFDPDGWLWVATSHGLTRIGTAREPFEAEEIPLDGARLSPAPSIWDLQIDRRGRLWITTDAGELLRRDPDGTVVSLDMTPQQPFARSFAVMEDHDGRIWVGHALGVTVFELDDDSTPVYYGPDRIGEGTVIDLVQLADGTTWITRAKGGMTRFDGKRFDLVPSIGDIEGMLPKRMSEDRDGNLWISTSDAGALRLATLGFSGYDIRDGLPYTRGARLLVRQDSNLAISLGDSIYELRGDSFEQFKPPVLQGLGTGSSTDNPGVLRDRQGRWWIGARDRLFRFPAVPAAALTSTPPEAMYESEALAGKRVMNLFEARNGDIWATTFGGTEVFRWSAADESIHAIEAGGTAGIMPRGIAEDAVGNVWISGLGFVLRYRNGTMERFERETDLRAVRHTGLLLDSRDRLLLASHGEGVWVLDDPAASEARFRPLVDPASLPSDRVSVLVEDRHGRIYIGTDVGVVRVDLDGNFPRHFTAADGLANNEVWDATIDKDGAVWFTTLRGVYRLHPSTAPAGRADTPPIWIHAVRAAGRAHPVAPLGQSRIDGIRLAFDEAHVAIAFGSLSFKLGQPVRYEYRLDGAEERWSTPSSERSVTYASLGSGRYRFLVRAVDSEGTVSAEPASVEFLVLAPFWRRGWFLATVALTVALAVWVVYRYRVARLVELERVRTRIATDLHDDIGSSLSQIAILAEIRRSSAGSDPILDSIGTVSREMVDSLSDIVWAINPRRDSPDDLVRRMRRFATDLLEAQEIELNFDAPSPAGGSGLGTDFRREMYLVFKESINNAARHSGCSTVRVAVRFAAGRFRLVVGDDGRGFDPSQLDGEGNGLRNMRMRAQRLGGTLAVDSAVGEGTELTFDVPLRRPSPLPEWVGD